jgi:hypothetical protein
MKKFLPPSLIVAAAMICFPAIARTETRTIANTRAFASEQLQSEMPAKLYQSLANRPIEGWIKVSGFVSSSHFDSAKVVQSDLNGAYDSVALQIAKEANFYGVFQTGTLIPSKRVSLHILIYPAEGGKMILACMHAEQASYHAGPQVFSYKGGKLKHVYP